MSTNGTVFGVFSGATFAAAFTNPSQLDVFQVINEGGKCVWKCDFQGNVTVNPSTFTSSALFPELFGATFAAALASASQTQNPLDFIQIISPVGAVLVYHIDSAGNSHTP
jgi:hypothetical protein